MNITPQAPVPTLPDSERLAYSVEESTQRLGVHYFSVYRMTDGSLLVLPYDL